MEEHPIAIEVRNLTKRYGGKSSPESLKNVSFQIPLGQTCCLLGPNGSGKTTLLKILAGLLEPTSGSISILGVDPALDPSGVKANIGWMPAQEKAGFYGRLTGRQNLYFFGTLNDLSKETMDRAIGNVALQLGINDELDKMMLKISSGSKQKISLARALLHNPPILLLDEPVQNLDPHTTLRFRRLLKDHLTRIQKKTVILSTHLLEEARRVADLILIIRDGEIIRTLPAKELEKELRFTSVEEFYMKTVDEPKSA
jgi:ABC-type multidrug transport system ATPase subunit